MLHFQLRLIDVSTDEAGRATRQSSHISFQDEQSEHTGLVDMPVLVLEPGVQRKLELPEGTAYVVLHNVSQVDASPQHVVRVAFNDSQGVIELYPMAFNLLTIVPGTDIFVVADTAAMLDVYVGSR